jgi:hypothetical protein
LRLKAKSINKINQISSKTNFYYDYIEEFHYYVFEVVYPNFYYNVLDKIVKHDFKEICQDYLKTPPPIENYFANTYGFIVVSSLQHLISLIKKINEEKLFSFDFEFGSISAEIEIAQISLAGLDKKIINYVIYYKRLLNFDTCIEIDENVRKTSNEIDENGRKINKNKLITLIYDTKVDFYLLFLNKSIKKIGFGLTQDIKNLTNERPDSTKLIGWFDFLKDPKSYQLMDLQYRRENNQEIGLSDFVKNELNYPINKSMQCSSWENYPLSSSQCAYASTDSLVVLLAYLNGAKTEHGQNYDYDDYEELEGWSFGPNDQFGEKISEFNEFVEEMSKQQINESIISNEAIEQIVQPSTSKNSIEQEVEIELMATDNEFIEQIVQPSTSKKTITLDQYKKRKAQDSLEEPPSKLIKPNLGPCNSTARIYLKHFWPFNIDTSYDADENFGKLFIEPLFKHLMGPVVKWHVMRKIDKYHNYNNQQNYYFREDIIVKFQNSVDKNDLSNLIDHIYNNELNIFRGIKIYIEVIIIFILNCQYVLSLYL